MSQDPKAEAAALMNRAAQAINGARLEMSRSPVTAAERLQDAMNDAARAQVILLALVTPTSAAPAETRKAA